MKRILFTLVAALAVFVGTIIWTDIYIRIEVKELAHKEIKKTIQVIAEDISYESECAQLQLMNYFASRLSDGAHASDSLATSYTSIHIKPARLNYTADNFESIISPLLTQNSVLMDVCLLVDSVRWAEFPQFAHEAPAVSKEIQANGTVDIQGYNYFDYSDLRWSKELKRCKESRTCFFALPTDKELHNRGIFCFYVPVYLTDDSFLGGLVATIKISSVEEAMKASLPYGPENSQMIVYDDQWQILFSQPRDEQPIATMDEMLMEWEKSGVQYEERVDVNIMVSTYQGEEFYSFDSTIPDTSWRIYVACKTSAVLQQANRIQYMVILTALVGMLLMALCSYVVYNQLKCHNRKKQMAEDELRMAAQVQLEMLRGTHYSVQFPGQSAVLANLDCFMKPAKEAGGDLYDYVEKDGKLIFCIGDVSGKGMPAALFMSQVVCLFRNAVNVTLHPEQIMSMINNVLSENNPSMTFCTMMVGVLQGTHLQICNGGHCQPVLVTTDSIAYTNFPVNIAVGLMGDFPYESREMEFQQGDKFLFYTDGVTEARSKAGGFYGEDKLLEFVRQDASVEHVVQSVTDFETGTEQSDDITVVMLTIQ